MADLGSVLNMQNVLMQPSSNPHIFSGSWHLEGQTVLVHLHDGEQPPPLEWAGVHLRQPGSPESAFHVAHLMFGSFMQYLAVLLFSTPSVSCFRSWYVLRCSKYLLEQVLAHYTGKGSPRGCQAGSFLAICVAL